MSIFKESFKKFVQKQIAVRQALLGHGNDGSSRFKSQTVNFKDVGGSIAEDSNLTLDAGAFYTLSQKTCVIRMASGGDLTDEGAVELGFDKKYFSDSQIKGSGLARRFVLMGGTLAIDRSTEQFENTKYKESQKARVDKVVGKTWEKGYSKQKSIRKEKYTYNLAKRTGGIAGTGGANFGTSYGDPTIASAAGTDNYGAVPMPGISKMSVATKSAYGSLREATVEFHCHNQRQLQALELLYMRPGIPILLEWGWSQWIDNNGKIRGVKSGDWPFESTLGKWFIREFPLSQLFQNVLEEKKESGGNYDAMVGFCKNFRYKARPDGGYDCTTEIIAQGEVLGSLKGEKMTIGKETKDAMEMGLDIFLQFSNAVADTTSNLGENRWGVTNALYFGWKAITSPKKIGFAWLISRVSPYATAGFIIYSAFANAKRVGNIAEGEELFDLFDLNETDENGVFVNAVNGNAEGRLTRLKQYILHEEQYIGGTNTGMFIKQPYIRWDALCYFLNKSVINKDSTGKPMMQLTCVNTREDNSGNSEENYKVEPLFYAKLPRITVPYLDPVTKHIQRTEVYTDDTAWYTFNLDYNGEININDLIDMSVDPSTCLLPGQVAENSTDPTSLYDTTMETRAGKALLQINPLNAIGVKSYNWINNKKRVLTADTSGREVGADWKRIIGHIYINLPKLRNLYENERYDNDGNLNKDFNLFDYLKKVRDDINASTGHNHKFMLQNDFERPDVVRIVDMQFQKEETLRDEDIIELKIQSNETICREFSYNSLIPSALSTTIATAVQNPDSTGDIETASWRALSKNVRSRFHVPKSRDKKETINTDEIKNKSDEYDGMLQNLRDEIDALFEHRVKIMKGKFERVDEDGKAVNSKKVGKMSQTLQNVYATIIKEKTLYPWNGVHDDGTNFYKGFEKRNDYIPEVSAVIPLKFNAKLDGISGIVIGNVFKIDPTRLPQGYKTANVGFVAMKESQDITAGGDWTTKIEGSMIMLPRETENLGDYPKELGSNFFDEEKSINYATETDAAQNTTYQGTILKEQSIIDPQMEDIKIGSTVYHKIGKEEKSGTNVRFSARVDNESFFDFGEDNIIGMIKPSAKGIPLGKVIKISHQSTTSNMEWSAEEQAYMMKDPSDGVIKKAELFTNKSIPWYLIQFNYTEPYFYKNFDLGQGRNWDNEIDDDGANGWKAWFKNANPPGTDTGYGPSWWANNYKNGQLFFTSYKGNNYSTPGNIIGQGWMRFDTLQSNPAFGFNRQENIDRSGYAYIAGKYLSPTSQYSSQASLEWSNEIINGWNNAPKTKSTVGGLDSVTTREEIFTARERAKMAFEDLVDQRKESGQYNFNSDLEIKKQIADGWATYGFFETPIKSSQYGGGDVSEYNMLD